MLGAVWGLAAVGRMNRKGMPGLLDAALLAEAFGDEMVLERPPRVVQHALGRNGRPDRAPARPVGDGRRHPGVGHPAGSLAGPRRSGRHDLPVARSTFATRRRRLECGSPGATLGRTSNDIGGST
jgi:hypothetical protein